MLCSKHVVSTERRPIASESAAANYLKIPMNCQRVSLPSQHVMCCKHEVHPDFLEKG